MGDYETVGGGGGDYETVGGGVKFSPLIRGGGPKKILGSFNTGA